jgi:hypothetical protein
LNKDLKQKLLKLENFPQNIIKQNASVVRTAYSLEKIGRVWLNTFKKASGKAKVPTSVHKELLEIFSDPKTLRLMTA